MNTSVYYKEMLTAKQGMVIPPNFAYDYFGYAWRFDSTLWVWADKWEVHFSKSERTGHSPMRRNYHFKDVSFAFDSNTFEKHIMSLPECLDMYFLKKAQLPADINYSIAVKPGIKVSCGKISDGVSCFNGYYHFKTKENLQKIMNYFEYIKRKAEEKMIVLKGIN